MPERERGPDTEAGERARGKLAAARARLVLERPFIGTLLLHLPMVPGDGRCRTLQTDARRILYDSRYVLALRPGELLFVLSRAALYCAFGYFTRRGHRIRHRWNLACELSINGILTAEGLEPPPGTLVLDAYRGMAAEEIYPMLDDSPFRSGEASSGEAGADGGGGDEGGNTAPQVPGGRGEFRPPEERYGEDSGIFREPDVRGAAPGSSNSGGAADLARAWRQRTASALLQTGSSGQLSGLLERQVESSLDGRVDWRALLARFLTDSARENYRWTRPSTRRGPPGIFPGLRSDAVNMAVSLDVSGSIGDRQLDEVVTEVGAIKDQIRARVTLYACDAALVDDYPVVYEPWEPLVSATRIRGGGSTDFRPVFDHLDRQDTRPDVLVWFTDGLGRMPAAEPRYPVIWLIKGGARVPWGTRVQY